MLQFIKKYIKIGNRPLTERCQSGLMCPLGKRVYRKVSEVRILFSPPRKAALLGAVFSWRREDLKSPAKQGSVFFVKPRA